MNAVLAIAQADFRERSRRFRFLLVMLATVAFGLLMLPKVDAGYTVLQVGQARGIYNAAWIGLVIGVVGATVLPLLGFFVIKDALARDRDSQVGILLAATPISGWRYLLGKCLSNLLVLLSIIAVAAVIAQGLQYWRAEDLDFRPHILLLHVFAVATPVLLATSALAVAFECLPGLRGAFGNVVFFFLWAFTFGPGLSSMDGKDRIVERIHDVYGISAPLADFEDHLRARNGGEVKGGMSIGANIGAKPPTVLPWPGIADDLAWLRDRLLWCLLVLPLLLIAVLSFDRFSPDKRRFSLRAEAPPSPTIRPAVAPPISALPPFRPGVAGLALFAGEWRLLWQGRPWWLWFLFVAVLIAQLANDSGIGLRYLAPLAWLLAITVYSEFGTRALHFDTWPLLRSAPRPVLRQLPVQWLAGTVFALLLTAPIALKLLFGGQFDALAQLLVGAGFVAALSLGLGALGSSRLFELAYMMLWYAGSQSAPGTAFAGELGKPFGASPAPVYLGLSAALLVLAALIHGRRH